MITSRQPLGLLLCVLLAGCSPPEEFEDTLSAEALAEDPPEITTLGVLLAPRETRLGDQDAEDLLSRAEAAEARAASIR